MKKRVATRRKSKRAGSGTKSTAKRAKKSSARKKATRRPGTKARVATARAASSASRNGRSTTGQKVQVGASAGRKTQKSKSTRAARLGNHAPSVLDKTSKPSDRATRAERTRTGIAPSATSHDPIQFREERRRKVKTYLTAKELIGFRELLLQKRAEIAGDVEHLTFEALNRSERGSGEQSAMPIHMADLGSDTWEQDFTLGLIAGERAVVREIDEALERIADKTYGICVATEKPIPRDRLRAKPWARYCIEYARLREEGRAP